MQRYVGVLLGVLLWWMWGCWRPPRTDVQRIIDSVFQQVEYCSQFYIIDANTLRDRIHRGRTNLATIDSTRMDAMYRSQLMQYRGILEIYRNFLKVYPSYEWDFHMLEQRANRLAEAWHSEQLSGDSVYIRARRLHVALDRHCKEIREWVRKIVEVEPLYNRLSDRVSQWVGDSLAQVERP